MLMIDRNITGSSKNLYEVMRCRWQDLISDIATSSQGVLFVVCPLMFVRKSCRCFGFVAPISFRLDGGGGSTSKLWSEVRSEGRSEGACTASSSFSMREC